MLSVHHPEPAVREAAVKQLGLVLGHKVGCGCVHGRGLYGSLFIEQHRTAQNPEQSFLENHEMSRVVVNPRQSAF